MHDLNGVKMNYIIKRLLSISLICTLGFSFNVFSTSGSQAPVLKAKTIGFICHKIRRGQIDTLIDYLDDAKIYLDSIALYKQIKCVDSAENVDHLLLTAVKSKRSSSVLSIIRYIKNREKLTNNSKSLFKILNASYANNNKLLLDWTIAHRKLNRNNKGDYEYYSSLEKLFRGFGAKECTQYQSTTEGMLCTN